MTETTTTPSLDEPRYPEHAKQAKILHLSQGIFDFLQFAQTEGVDFGRTVTERAAVFEGTEDITAVRPVEGPELRALLAKHFGIDMNVIEDEKRQMLDDMRAMNAPKEQ